MTGRNDLEPLLDHLSGRPFFQPHYFHGWRVTPVSGGANNLIYRATDVTTDLAVKFTLRDARNRAEREYQALTALQRLGLHLAPAPVWLESDRYPHPVVVQEWLAGEVLTAPPQTDAAWERLLQLCNKVHSVTPEMTRRPIKAAVFGSSSPAEAKQLVFKQADLIPQPARPTELRVLLKTLASASTPDVEAEHVLCHVDANVGNFIVRSGELYAVDWEGSGWSDPAFEMANLMTHPAYLSVSRSRWEWVVSTYTELSRADAVAERIGAYHPILVVFWVVRLARTLYEVPRGLDERLVHRPDDWQEDAEKKYQHYLTLAETLF